MPSSLFPLLLSLWVAGQQSSISNLDFNRGTLSGWEGDGFLPVAMGKAPSPGYWVSSSDKGSVGRKATLHRTFLLPAGTGVIHFKAYAARGKDCQADKRLDVLLLDSEKHVIPKQVRAAKGWQPVSSLLPLSEGQAQEYLWRVAAYAGRPVKLVLLDDDDRPGCSIECSGFHLVTAEEFEIQEFCRLMVRLTRDNKLTPMVRYDSAHFMALSNIEDGLSEMHLRDCELLYRQFYDHFRRKGFSIVEPTAKLMVAMFDTQTGFEAYLEQRIPPLLSGMYHLRTNRFVMYDYGQNKSYLSRKDQAEHWLRRIPSQLDRQRYMDAFHRRAQEFSSGATIGTVMHEVAHQVSFNCGMLCRDRDVPVWLAEGLACYCEPTANGTWQGIGEPNPGRIFTLSDTLRKKRGLLSIRDLVDNDRWVRGPTDSATISLGYAQSWALFRMLMEERPLAVRTYCRLVSSRQTSERRWADFQEAIGTDLWRQEQRYEDYIGRLLQENVPSKR